MKTIFIDVDGTLNGYATEDDKVNASSFPYGFFLNRLPVIPVINKIWELYKNENLVVLSAIPHIEAIVEKNMWLDRHFPIEERYFIAWRKETKVDFIENYIKEHNLNKEDCILIDDEHDILREVENAGIQVYHPSRILTLNKCDLK